MIDLWLRHVRQEGLVVSQSALDGENLVAIKQTANDTQDFTDNANDFWKIATEVLDWPQSRILRGENLPDEATCRLTEMDVTLRVDAALSGKQDELPRLLIKVLNRDTDPDARTSIGRWSGITEQQAFERHLRETGVEQGLLVTDEYLRLTYSPRGETPGFLEWPLKGLKATAGREMLAGFKLLLGKNAIWGSAESRLNGILKRSRENQNIVSTKLADQVLGALYSLLRGFTSEAETDTRLRAVAQQQPQEFYEGLLSVLMRLVFVLYAEDRGLMPSADNEHAKQIYEQGYAVRRLFVDLEDDAALYPDTMADRYGAWGRLLGLFQLIHDGAGPDFMHQRRGKLFDPGTFPFLLGQFEEGDAPDVLPVSDKCIYEVLHQLLMLGGERLSYKTLDVEQIGSVYETVMGFTVTRSHGSSIALKSGKGNIPAYINLEAVLAKAPANRKKFLADTIDYTVTDAQNKLIKPAGTVDDLLAALDKKIDERGSPNKRIVTAGTIILQPTDERRKTGSHYTPRSLTAPIVREALEPILAQLGEDATPDQVLDLKICDPAMGSGAFLVETCRALGERLEAAWVRHSDLLPDEARSDPQVFARREVAKRCLYGVDKNHMATDLAKLSLWLVTLSKDEDFSFLDHALKTGDSLVGLTLNQISCVSWEDNPTKSSFAEHFVKQVNEARVDRRRIRTAPDNVTFEAQKQRLDEANSELTEVRLIGDATIAAFFSENNNKKRTEALHSLQDQLGFDNGQDVARQMRHGLNSGPHPITPFHWQIEFPEVFEGDNAGFDSIVGNPPFAGKNTITHGNRAGFLDWLKIISPASHGNADLSAHFFRRAYALLREGGTMGLIATNTIGQGDTRESGLRWLLAEADGVIYRAKRRVKWPGDAAVVVSTVHMAKGAAGGAAVRLDTRAVSRISAFLREGDFDDTPAVLEENADKAFRGQDVYGMGFTFDDTDKKGIASPLSEMRQLNEIEPQNAAIIRPYLGGEEVNSHPQHLHHRYVINFGEMPLRRNLDLAPWANAEQTKRREWLQTGIVPADYPEPVAADWPDLLAIVEERVKPARLKSRSKSIRTHPWWKHWRFGGALAEGTNGLKTVFVLSRVSSNLGIGISDNAPLFADSTVVFAFDTFSPFAILQSRIHEIWARVFSSSMKDDLRYAPSDCFATFPFSADYDGNELLEKAGRDYHNNRASLMMAVDEGLTKTYNRFHNPTDRKDDITELRRLHAAMDDAVLRAYGWEDLADMAADTSSNGAAPRFLHRTDEPEFAYQKRYHWPAWFRDKVLARLLALNRARAAAAPADTGKMKPRVLQIEEKGSLI